MKCAPLNVTTMHNVSTPKLHNVFGPKELFPLTSKNTEPNSKIDNYTNLTLMDKHLSRVQNDIESNEDEIQKQKYDIEDVSQHLSTDDDLDSRSTCSFCHYKGHKKTIATEINVLPPCHVVKCNCTKMK